MLLVEDLLKALLVLVQKRGPAQVIQQVQHRLVPVPEVLLCQNLHPELQNCNGSHAASSRTFQDMGLVGKFNTLEVTGVRLLSECLFIYCITGWIVYLKTFWLRTSIVRLHTSRDYLTSNTTKKKQI